MIDLLYSNRWEYISVDYDIGFGIYYKPDTTDDKRVHASDMHPVVNID